MKASTRPPPLRAEEGWGGLSPHTPLPAPTYPQHRGIPSTQSPNPVPLKHPDTPLAHSCSSFPSCPPPPPWSEGSLCEQRQLLPDGALHGAKNASLGLLSFQEPQGCGTAQHGKQRWGYRGVLGVSNGKEGDGAAGGQHSHTAHTGQHSWVQLWSHSRWREQGLAHLHHVLLAQTRAPQQRGKCSFPSPCQHRRCRGEPAAVPHANPTRGG